MRLFGDDKVGRSGGAEMALHWIPDFIDEVKRPRGWSLMAKSLAGVIALLAGLATIASLAQARAVEESATVSARMTDIQTGLLSENSYSRIAALRALEAFARDSTHDNLSNSTLRSQAWWFPRRALRQAVDAAKPAAEDGGSAPAYRSAPARERYE